MRDGSVGSRHKRHRSSSGSSGSSSSSNDRKYKNRSSSEERGSHRKQDKREAKWKRHVSVDSSDSEDVRPKHKSSDKEHKREFENVRVKEEPLSEDERAHHYKNRHNEQSRSNHDRNRRHESRGHRDGSRRKDESSDSRGANDRNRRPDKDKFRDFRDRGTEPEPEWGKKEIKKETKEQKNNAKPDFGLSGKLTEDANTFNGVVIKYSEPPEARRPKRKWRLYPFKGETSLPILHIHRQSAYLLGRDRKVADIPIDHPSCSKQHAALQYRLVPFTRADGSKGRQIKLYVIDLESANGTFLNNNKIEVKKYYEVKERDVIKFGFSSREYVLLHEHSKGSENDDDVLNDD